jgi:hypothetical protein
MPLNSRGQSTFGAVAAMMEADSAQFQRQAFECPNDLSVWTKLYAASETMLSAMRENKVASALVELCSNLLGCEELAIVDISRADAKVRFLLAEGLSPTTRSGVAESGKTLESQIQPGIPWIPSDKSDHKTPQLESLGVNALIPLWSDTESSGAILLFQLLPQRSGFDIEDRHILQFLATHAGQCLRSRDRG